MPPVRAKTCLSRSPALRRLVRSLETEQTAESYRLQLNAYRQAAATFLGIDALAIEAVVLFVTPGVAIKIA